MALNFSFKKNKATRNYELKLVAQTSNDAIKILMKKFGKKNDVVKISTSENENKIIK